MSKVVKVVSNSKKLNMTGAISSAIVADSHDNEDPPHTVTSSASASGLPAHTFMHRRDQLGLTTCTSTSTTQTSGLPSSMAHRDEQHLSTIARPTSIQTTSGLPSSTARWDHRTIAGLAMVTSQQVTTQKLEQGDGRRGGESDRCELTEVVFTVENEPVELSNRRLPMFSNCSSGTLNTIIKRWQSMWMGCLDKASGSNLAFLAIPFTPCPPPSDQRFFVLLFYI